MNNTVNTAPTIFKSFLNTYGMVCFSNNKIFGLLVLIATFSDPLTGLCGLIATFTAILLEELLLNTTPHQKDGSYTFNSLLSGLALGALLPPFPFTIILVMVMSCLTLVLTTFFIRTSARTGLPYLSIPFVFIIWLLLFGLTVFHYPPYMFRQEQLHVFSNLLLPDNHVLLPIKFFLRSLSSIYFQNDELAGLLVLIGLVVHSRIAFVLSLVGFIGIQFIYWLLPHLPPPSFLNLTMNAVLMLLALSGHYLLPSRRSLLVSIISLPLLTLINLGLGAWLQTFLLPAYSISFSITTFLVLAVVHQRGPLSWPRITHIQYNSPEQNLYNANSLAQRFKHWKSYQLKVPFYGEWFVSQGYNGKITHKKGFKHALDFVVNDDFGRTFKNDGKTLLDFYCYQLPVLAAAPGEVVYIKNGIEDNAIGDSDFLNNWGNTVIIKHADGLYSKYSHLQKGAIMVTTGQLVRSGETIGVCGNSGRSPEPHLHFQLQETDLIDGTTLPYPFHAVLQNANGILKFKKYYIPNEGERIKRPVINETLKHIFQFYEGQEWQWETETNGSKSIEKWVCRKDQFGQLYLHALEADATFYVTQEEQFIMSSSYAGSKKCLLFSFYKAMHTVPLCSEKEFICEDVVSPAVNEDWFKDVLSLWQPAKPLRYENKISMQDSTHITLHAQLKNGDFVERYETLIQNGHLISFTNLQNHSCARFISCI